MTAMRDSSKLSDLLYALALDGRQDRAAVLDEFTRAHPEHAAALTDFAIELAADAMAPGSTESRIQPAAEASGVSPAVSRALSRFENRLFALSEKAAKSPTRTPDVNPFASLDQSTFHAFAERLGCTRLFAMKVRDRQIDPESMPEGFVRRVAEILLTQVDTLMAYFTEPTRVSIQPQFFKAEQQPTAGSRQSYREAVESSGLSAEQKHHLLKI